MTEYFRTERMQTSENNTTSISALNRGSTIFMGSGGEEVEMLGDQPKPLTSQLVIYEIEGEDEKNEEWLEEQDTAEKE